MDEHDVAQAVELVRALRDQPHEMTHRGAWLERQFVTDTSGRPLAIRCEAAALRVDIDEAQFLVDRPERRYLNGNGHAQPRLPEQPRRSVATGNQIAPVRV